MTEAEAAIDALLSLRGAGKTICPSEAARHIAKDGEDWRDHMPSMHDAVDAMHARNAITLSWQGEVLSGRHGPYRVARRLPASRQNS